MICSNRYEDEECDGATFLEPDELNADCVLCRIIKSAHDHFGLEKVKEHMQLLRLEHPISADRMGLRLMSYRQQFRDILFYSEGMLSYMVDRLRKVLAKDS